MAKVKSLIELKGTLSGLNFYTRQGVAVVRAAGGGFNGDAIRTKPSMLHVRENGNGELLYTSSSFFKQGESFFGEFKSMASKPSAFVAKLR